MPISSDSTSFFLKSNRKFYAVALNSINWIQSQGSYCTIHTDFEPSEFEVRISLTKIKERLCSDCFLQTHRSYIVNIKKIKMYDPTGKIYINNQEVPVSKKYKSIIEDKFHFLT